MMNPLKRFDARLPLIATLPLLLALVPFERRAGGEALDGDFADPFVLYDDDGYWAYATGIGTTHVQVARSRDLTTWARVGDALPRLGAWAVPDEGLTWAPSVLRRDEGYVLYYT